MDSDEVMEVILRSLRIANDKRINDVDRGRGVYHEKQIILTTDDGGHKQVWVIDGRFIIERKN